MKTKTLTLSAILTAVALTIFLVEAQIPALVPVPGIKLGLSNIVTMFAVFVLGGKEALAILLARVFLGAIFSGQPATIAYSAAGGILALLCAIALKRILTTRQIWVAGCLGAIAHSIGQMAVAVLLTGTPQLLIYLPVMLLCSIATGLFTGLCAQVLVNRRDLFWKTFLK